MLFNPIYKVSGGGDIVRPNARDGAILNYIDDKYLYYRDLDKSLHTNQKYDYSGNLIETITGTSTNKVYGYGADGYCKRANTLGNGNTYKTTIYNPSGTLLYTLGTNNGISTVNSSYYDSIGGIDYWQGYLYYNLVKNTNSTSYKRYFIYNTSGTLISSTNTDYASGSTRFGVTVIRGQKELVMYYIDSSHTLKHVCKVDGNNPTVLIDDGTDWTYARTPVSESVALLGL